MPVLAPHITAPGESLTIGSSHIQIMDQDHGFSKTPGFRFGSIAYDTDVKNMPEDSFHALRGAGTWITGAPVTFGHPTRIDVTTALEWIEKINPDRAILSHLGAALDG